MRPSPRTGMPVAAASLAVALAVAVAVAVDRCQQEGKIYFCHRRESLHLGLHRLGAALLLRGDLPGSLVWREAVEG